MSVTVYVALPDELVDVWRPVDATPIAPGVWRLHAQPQYDPALERWEFPPGSAVRCEQRRIDGRSMLVAVSLAESSAAR